MSGCCAFSRRYCCIIGVWLLKPGSFKLFSYSSCNRTDCRSVKGWICPSPCPVTSQCWYGGRYGSTPAWPGGNPLILKQRIIADLRAGEECADPTIRVRGCDVRRGAGVLLSLHRVPDEALREIKLGELGTLTLAEAQEALGRLKLERRRGVNP